MFLKFSAVSLAIFISLSSAKANDALNLEDDFLQSLAEVSQIATKTKLNIDDTISLVTVLQSKKLQKLGANDVYDALSFVPGIELRREATGIMSVVFRGSATKGEVKFMIDGVEINNAYRSSYYYFLDFPIELISRIEILRGNGGILYGSGAINGVINIITKTSQNNSNKLFISKGTHSSTKGGAIISANYDKLKLSVDAHYCTDDKVIDSVDYRTTDHAAGINIKLYDLNINARIKNSVTGMGYGLFGVADTNENKYENINETIYANLKYKINISKTNELNIGINYSEYAQKLEDYHPDLSKTLTTNYKEKTSYTKIELINSSIKNNQLLLGVKYNNAKTSKTDLMGHPLISDIVMPNIEREIYSLYMNDNYTLNGNTNLFLGFRYADYSDFGSNFSPHLGLTHKLSDKLRLKLKHAHAFRAPSWTELYGINGNTTLEAEVSSNLEIGIIYKHSNTNRLALNIYTTKIDNAIIMKSGEYDGNNKLDLTGIELDYNYSPKHNIELGLIASYIDAKDADNNKLPYIANFLTTASLIYSLDSGVNFGSVLRYINAQNIDNKPIFDQIISYPIKDFNFSLSVKNLFDSEVIYYDTNHDKSNPIVDAQRTVYAKASWEF